MVIFLTLLTGKHLVMLCMLVFCLGPTTEINPWWTGSTKVAHYFMVHWSISLEHELLNVASCE